MFIGTALQTGVKSVHTTGTFFRLKRWNTSLNELIIVMIASVQSTGTSTSTSTSIIDEFLSPLGLFPRWRRFTDIFRILFSRHIPTGSTSTSTYYSISTFLRVFALSPNIILSSSTSTRSARINYTITGLRTR
jgi:hypothetical protein